MSRAIQDLDGRDAWQRYVLRNQLADARRAQGMSQRTFADVLGVHQVGVVRRETRDQWRMSTVQQWAQALRMNFVAELHGYELRGHVITPSPPASAAMSAGDRNIWHRAVLVQGLINIRRGFELRQSDVAKTFGCSASALCQFEQRANDFRVAYAQRYARALALAINRPAAHLNLRLVSTNHP